MKIELDEQTAKNAVINQLIEMRRSIEDSLANAHSNEWKAAYRAFPYNHPAGPNLEELVSNLGAAK